MLKSVFISVDLPIPVSPGEWGQQGERRISKSRTRAVSSWQLDEGGSKTLNPRMRERKQASYSIPHWPLRVGGEGGGLGCFSVLEYSSGMYKDLGFHLNSNSKPQKRSVKWLSE